MADSKRLPRFASDDQANGYMGNRERLGQIPLQCAEAVKFADEGNSVGIKRQGSLGSSLRGAIAHIVSLIPWKQMIGAETRRIIALVQNINTVRDGAMNHNPRGAVGVAFIGGSSAINFAVALLVACAQPFHAGVILRDGFQQFRKQFGIGKIVTHRVVLLDSWCWPLERSSALGPFQYIPQGGLA